MRKVVSELTKMRSGAVGNAAAATAGGFRSGRPAKGRRTPVIAAGEVRLTSAPASGVRLARGFAGLLAAAVLFFGAGALWAGAGAARGGAGTGTAREAQAVGSAQSNQSIQSEERDAFVKAYRIGPGDLLEIKVFEIDQLNQTVRVSEDGAVTLPLIGRVEVEGLTQDAVVARLTDLLKAKYVKDPQVTIFIKEYKSNQVAVIGAVKEPGSYELVGRKNLLQVISMAGGFTENAMDVIYVLRQADGAGGSGGGSGGGAARTIPIDLRELIVKGNQELNIPIEPNDVVNVPIDKEIRVFVMGRVNKPGAVRFKLSENATLLQAIADAGGFAEGARRGAVVITRKDRSGKERKIRVNIKDILSGKRKDIALEEGDVIFVPESFW